MRHALLATSLLTAAAALTGCDDTIFGAGGGEVEGEGYAAVLSINEAECTGCHSAGDAPAGGGLDLETDFIAATVNVTGAYDLELIVPGEPENSLLYQMTTGVQPVSGAMPFGTGGLTAEQNAVIEQWILDGALDQ